MHECNANTFRVLKTKKQTLCELAIFYWIAYTNVNVNVVVTSV